MGLSATAFPPCPATMTVVCGCTFTQRSPVVTAICRSAVGALPSSVILEPRRAGETGRVIARHAALSSAGGPDCSVDVGLWLAFLGCAGYALQRRLLLLSDRLRRRDAYLTTFLRSLRARDSLCCS